MTGKIYILLSGVSFQSKVIELLLISTEVHMLIPNRTMASNTQTTETMKYCLKIIYVSFR